MSFKINERLIYLTTGPDVENKLHTFSGCIFNYDYYEYFDFVVLNSSYEIYYVKDLSETHYDVLSVSYKNYYYEIISWRKEVPKDVLPLKDFKKIIYCGNRAYMKHDSRLLYGILRDYFNVEDQIYSYQNDVILRIKRLDPMNYIIIQEPPPRTY